MLADTEEHLEVVRQQGTGLFMIRIDHLDLRSFEEAIGDKARADRLILPDKVLAELEAEFNAKHGLSSNHESCPEPGTSPSAQDNKWSP